MKIYFLITVFTLTITVTAQRGDFDTIDFAQADRMARKLEGEDLKNLPFLAHKLTAHLETEAAQFRAIYYWVSHNIKGNYDLTLSNDRHQRRFKNDTLGYQLWNRQFKKEIFARMIEDKETLCIGYAYLIQQLATLAGIDCEIVYGYDTNNAFKTRKPTPNHSWNAVKLNGKWYLCDVTWSTGYTDMTNNTFVMDYDNTHFLMEPARFAKSHKPVDEKWTLLEEN